MDRRNFTDKSQEEKTRSTGKSGKSGKSRLPSWYQRYIFEEEPTDNQRPLHGDPRDKHDNDFIPSDDDSDPGYGHPGVGIGPMSDFSASASSASDQGTLAGVKGKRTDAGTWAKNQLKVTGQYEKLQNFWVNQKNKAATTQEQKEAYSAYKANIKQYNRTGQTTATNSTRDRSAIWRAAKDTQAGTSYGKLGPWSWS